MGRGRRPPLIVLDTHAWLWWCTHADRLSRKARSAIARHGQVGVSAISCWELTLLDRQDRLRFDSGAATWLREALAGEETELLPVTAEIAIRAGQVYPGLAEPADAIVYATAVQHDVQLVTRDERISSFDPARVIW